MITAARALIFTAAFLLALAWGVSAFLNHALSAVVIGGTR